MLNVMIGCKNLESPYIYVLSYANAYVLKYQ